jgi:hypothetical protein
MYIQYKIMTLYSDIHQIYIFCNINGAENGLKLMSGIFGNIKDAETGMKIMSEILGILGVFTKCVEFFGKCRSKWGIFEKSAESGSGGQM